MEERYHRSHFGPMVLAVVVGGMILHHLANHEHAGGHGSHHEHFAKMWQKHHARFHARFRNWADCYSQEEKPDEKSEDAA